MTTRFNQEGISIIALRVLALLKAFEISASLNPDTILWALDCDTPSETILDTRSSTLLFGIKATYQTYYKKLETTQVNQT